MAAYYHHDITGAAFVFWALSFFCSYLYFADAQEFETGVILDTLLTIYANRDWMVFWLTRPSFIRWMMGLLTFILAILSDLPGAFMWIKYHLAHPTRLLARGGPLPWSLAFWRQLILQSLFLFMDLVSFPTGHVVRYVMWHCSKWYARCPGWRDIVKPAANPYEQWDRHQEEARERQNQLVLRESKNDQDRVGSNEAHTKVSRRQDEV